MSDPQVFVGIDVSKAQLDVALRPTDDHWHVSNDVSGIASLVERLQVVQPTLVVLEATGGLEVPVTGALAEAGLPVVVVNPRHARDFAKTTGRLAKTDTLDARGLAHFAEAVRPMPRPLPEAHAQALSALVTRRRQVGSRLNVAGCRRLPSGSVRISRPTLPGWRAAWPAPMMTWGRRSAPVPCGVPQTRSCRAPRVSVPFSRRRWWQRSRNWGL